jgi:hypothetical protein
MSRSWGAPTARPIWAAAFPAAEDYRLELMRHGQAVGEALAREGALERYAVDFIARRFDRTAGTCRPSK